MIYLNSNLKTRVVGYMEERLKADIKTTSADRILHQEFFLLKNYEENVHWSLVLDPVLILINSPKQSI